MKRWIDTLRRLWRGPEVTAPISGQPAYKKPEPDSEWWPEGALGNMPHILVGRPDDSQPRIWFIVYAQSGMLVPYVVTGSSSEEVRRTFAEQVRANNHVCTVDWRSLKWIIPVSQAFSDDYYSRRLRNINLHYQPLVNWLAKFEGNPIEHTIALSRMLERYPGIVYYHTL